MPPSPPPSLTGDIYLRVLLKSYLEIMVSAKWSSLAAGAALLSTPSVAGPLPKRQFDSGDTVTAAQTLQGWYNKDSGLWDTAGWWNSGNCLTVLADLAHVDRAAGDQLGVAGIISNTFTNAQKSDVSTQKSMSASGLMQSTYNISRRVGAQDDGDLSAEGFSNFINEFYDDEGWWALAFIRSWDVTQDGRYLDVSKNIFEDMKNATDDTCGGGIWWNKDRQYKNAITNELYISVAASLANRVPDRKDYYLDIAKETWSWFKGSGMINGDNHINDGLAINADGTCSNNGANEWSYNQGVILGGLVELSKATGDSSYLDEAGTLAAAAISLLSDSNGVILERGCEPDCGGDGPQFKGIFVRNLGYLNSAAPQSAYRDTILKNADSIWDKARNTDTNQIGLLWNGPWNGGGDPNAATHSSATDALVAALSV